MKNNFGYNISMTLFGESHGPYIGITLDGLPAGFKIDLDQIHADLEQRKPKNKLSTPRKETDDFQIVSGYFNNHTTGSALTILIPNQNVHSADYKPFQLRPSHADFTAFEKYHGFQDYRGGGHFSGRLSACIVAAGSICRQILAKKGILIGSHIERIHHIQDNPFSSQIENEVLSMNQKDFAVLNPNAEEAMKKVIEQALQNQDSVGGILETAILHLPTGIGEPFFDSLESVLSHLLFSIPAVKGVSFGDGFEMALKYGSQANDAFVFKENTIQTKTNHNGGINGGISNGMPILIHTVIKPTPSIAKAQASVDYQTKEEIQLQIHGRHDPCIVHRARIVVDSIVAFGVLDLLMSHEANQL